MQADHGEMYVYMLMRLDAVATFNVGMAGAHLALGQLLTVDCMRRGPSTMTSTGTT